jgi:protein gp37
VSSECENCYAKTFAERFRGKVGNAYENGFDFALVPEKLREPLTLASSQMIFVNSMSDIFHKKAPDWYLERLAWVMLKADWHVYQILTKRAERMVELLTGNLEPAARAGHIWWGVSVGDKKHGLPRIDLLRKSEAKVKWLSIEPLLEDLGEVDFTGIDWVVVGGESGPGARPMKQEWVESLQQQCAAAATPFFFKQWGGVKKAATGRLLHDRTYDEMPPINVAPVAAKVTRKAYLEIAEAWTFTAT